MGCMLSKEAVHSLKQEPLWQPREVYHMPRAVSEEPVPHQVIRQGAQPLDKPSGSAAPGDLPDQVDVQQARDVSLDLVHGNLLSDSFTRNNASAGTPPDRAANELNPQFKWTRGVLLGVGAFGRVYLAHNSITGEAMAVKQVAFDSPSSIADREVLTHITALETEIAILCQLSHPNIVRFYGTERTPNTLNIFLEYVPCGSISSVLLKSGPFNETLLKCYTRQILQGLDYLHRRGYMHRDIKGANVLIDNSGVVKLADFGASKRIETLATIGSGAKSVKGTPYWMAPEVIKQTGHGRAADIWSVGCTVIEMATGKHPWGDLGNAMVAMFKIASSKDPPPFPAHLSPEAKDFLTLCFDRSPHTRSNASRLLRHPFITGLNGVTLPPPASPHDMPTLPRTLSTPKGNNPGATQLPGLANVHVYEYPTSGQVTREILPSAASAGLDEGSGSPHCGVPLPMLVLPQRVQQLVRVPSNADSGPASARAVPNIAAVAAPRTRPVCIDTDLPQPSPHAALQAEDVLLQDAAIVRVGSGFGQGRYNGLQSKAPGTPDATKVQQWEFELLQEMEEERRARQAERISQGQRV